jgi:hypothetical protein
MNRQFSSEYIDLLKGCGEAVAEPSGNRYFPVPKKRVSEKLIQLVWKNILFNNSSMRTSGGIPIKILKPGRLNRREGPDFKNSVFVLDGVKTAGDVEIHIESKEWYDHRHQLSPYYNRCLLHVFLNRSGSAPVAKTQKGRELHELELGLYLRHSMEELQKETEFGDNPLSGRTEIPPCRRHLLKSGVENIQRILEIVGEGRMLIKSNIIFERLESNSDEQVLFEIFFESLGYSKFKKEFGLLARRMPFEKLQEIIEQNSNVDPVKVIQSVYFRLSGLLVTADQLASDPELNGLLSIYRSVNVGDIEPVFEPSRWSMPGSRPANSPFRRIAGFSHLSKNFSDLHALRAIFESLPPSGNGLKVAKKRLSEIIENFRGVSDRFWDYRYSFNNRGRSPKKLIGKDRAISLVIDCLIPFFLAKSRSMHDLEMEKRLVSACYATPKPTSNSVIDFMIRNLFGKDNRQIVTSVLHQQALIQLHNDFCYRSPAYCTECPMPEYLKKFAKRG